MSDNPFASPPLTAAREAPSDVPLRVSYSVDQAAITDSAHFYSVSRLELLGAVGGVALILSIAVTSTILDHMYANWALDRRSVVTGSLLIVGPGLFAAWLTRRNLFRTARARIANSLLHQTGDREIIITPEVLTLRVNGQLAEWPMQNVRYLDRKSKRFRSRKQTILQLAPHLPLAIPDTGEFQGIRRGEFLKRLKQWCSNICLF